MPYKSFIVIGLLFLLTIFFLFILNSNNDNQDIYVFNKIKNIFTSNSLNEVKYLTHQKYFDEKEELKNIFNKFIILISERNVENIQNASYIEENFKKKILENINDIEVVPITTVKEIKIIEIQNDNFITEIVSQQLNNSNKTTVDNVTFKKTENQKFTISSILCTEYNNEFIHLYEYLEKKI